MEVIRARLLAIDRVRRAPMGTEREQRFEAVKEESSREVQEFMAENLEQIL